MRPMSALVAALLVALPVVVGCVRPENGGERPEGFRFVTGTVQVPDDDILGRQVTGLQVAGIAIGTSEDPADVDVFPSDVFDGSRVETSRFAALVAQDRSFVTVLQVPSATTNGPGTLVAVLRFNSGNGETTLVPPGDEDIELGTLTIEIGSSPATTTLVVSDAHNPAAQIDSDDDSTVDVLDADDDGDDVADVSDPDVGGDGVDDAAQVLTSLPDEDGRDDGDGTPDLLEG
jgi:hypothetical protein